MSIDEAMEQDVNNSEVQKMAGFIAEYVLTMGTPYPVGEKVCLVGNKSDRIHHYTYTAEEGLIAVTDHGLRIPESMMSDAYRRHLRKKRLEGDEEKVEILRKARRCKSDGEGEIASGLT